MRRLLTAAMLTSAFLMVGASVALAADKGGPPSTPYQAPAGTIVDDRPFAKGFFVEGSAGAANFKVDAVGTDTVSLFGLGIGYDHVINKQVVIGAFARYDISRSGDAHQVHLGARAGFLVNPHLLLYVPIAYTMDGKDIKIQDGIWSAGLGLETALLTNNLSLFAEAARNFALQGGARFLDEAYFVRAGVRLRF